MYGSSILSLKTAFKSTYFTYMIANILVFLTITITDSIFHWLCTVLVKIFL